MFTNTEIMWVLDKIIKEPTIGAIQKFAEDPMMDLSCAEENSGFDRRAWDDLCDTYRAKVLQILGLVLDLSKDQGPYLFFQLLLRKKWHNVISEFLSKRAKVFADLVSQLDPSQCMKLLITAFSIADAVTDVNETEDGVDLFPNSRSDVFEGFALHLLETIACTEGASSALCRIIVQALRPHRNEEASKMTIRDIIKALSLLDDGKRTTQLKLVT